MRIPISTFLLIYVTLSFANDKPTVPPLWVSLSNGGKYSFDVNIESESQRFVRLYQVGGYVKWQVQSPGSITTIDPPFTQGSSIAHLPVVGQLKITATDPVDEYVTPRVGIATVQDADEGHRLKAVADSIPKNQDKLVAYQKLIKSSRINDGLLADVHLSLGLLERSIPSPDLRSSIDNLKKARRLSLDEGQTQMLNYEIGVSEQLHGNYHAARTRFNTILGSKVTNSVTLDALNQLALLDIYQGNLVQAEEILYRSLASTMEDNVVRLAITYNNLGGLFLKKDRPDNAARFFDYAYSLYQRSGRHADRQVGALTNSAAALRMLGNYPATLQRLGQALELDPKDSYSRGGVFYELGRLFLETQHVHRSLAYFLAAKTAMLSTNDKQALARLDIDLARALALLGRSQEAEGLLKSSLDVLPGEIHGTLAATCELGREYVKNKRYADWTKLVRSQSGLFEIARQEGFIEVAACPIFVNALAYQDQGDYTASSTALRIVESAYLEAQSFSSLTMVGLELARNDISERKYNEALKRLQMLSLRLEKGESIIPGGLSRRQFMDSWREMVDLSLMANYYNAHESFVLEGYRLSLASKATLSHYLSSQREYLKRLDIAEVNSALKEHKIVRDTSENQSVMINLAAIDVSRFQASSLGTADVNAIPKTDEETVLVHYHSTPDLTFIWVTLGEEIKFYTTRGSDQIDPLAVELRHAIISQDQSRDMLAKSLAKALIHPFADYLIGKKVFVSGDRGIHLIPFSYLPVAKDQRLGDVADVAHIIGVGSPAQDSDPLREITIMTTNGMDKELASVTKVAEKGDLAFKRLVTDFTSSSSIETLLRASKGVIHISAHAYTDQTDASLSALTFTEDPFDSIQSGKALTSLSIASLDIPARLVVLSACETGLHTRIGLEGNSLAGSFLQAGAENVLATLWKVPKVAANRFSELFYNLLVEDRLPAIEALRRAQIQMRNERQFRDPYFWAGFRLSTKGVM